MPLGGFKWYTSIRIEASAPFIVIDTYTSVQDFFRYVPVVSQLNFRPSSLQ